MLNKSTIIVSSLFFLAHIPAYTGFFQKLPEYDTQTSCLEINNKMSVQAQYFSREDSIHYFNKDLIALGMRPVLVTLFNTSKSDYILRKEHFRLPLISTRKVIQTLSFSSNPFASSFLLSGLRTRSMSMVNLAALAGSIYYNKEIEAGLEANRLHKNRTYKLAPYHQITFLLFVAEQEFNPQFDLYYFDTATQKSDKVSIDLLKNIKNSDYFVPDLSVFD